MQMPNKHDIEWRCLQCGAAALGLVGLWGGFVDNGIGGGILGLALGSAFGAVIGLGVGGFIDSMICDWPVLVSGAKIILFWAVLIGLIIMFWGIGKPNF